jgi:hypothetical protein
MSEPSITLDDIRTLAALADGIIPADDRDSGAALVLAHKLATTSSRPGAKRIPRPR